MNEKRRLYNKENAAKRDAYNKKNYTLFSFRMSNENDKLLINYLNELDNRTDKIRSLLKQDLIEQLEGSNNNCCAYKIALDGNDASEKEVIEELKKQKDPESYIIAALKFKVLIDKANS